MKITAGIALLVLLYLQPAPAGVSFGVFYSSLAPHGQWIECNLGYVWRPNHVAHGWRPYMNGRWVWSDYGWYWVSAEPYGWATYHYGRWYYDDFYGWVWVPGETWGPAWVEWRYSDAYLGWAPLSPYAAFSVTAGVTFTHTWTAPYHYWNFVTYHNFSSERISECVQPVEQNTRIFGSTRGVVDIRSADNRIVNRGVELSLIEQRGNIHVRVADVVERAGGEGERISPGAGHERIEAFRPRLDAGLRDQITRPQTFEHATRQIATDFNKSPHEKQVDRMRSIEGNAPRSFTPRTERRPGLLPTPPQNVRPAPNGGRPSLQTPPRNHPGIQRPGPLQQNGRRNNKPLPAPKKPPQQRPAPREPQNREI